MGGGRTAGSSYLKICRPDPLASLELLINIKEQISTLHNHSSYLFKITLFASIKNPENTY